MKKGKNLTLQWNQHSRIIHLTPSNFKFKNTYSDTFGFGALISLEMLSHSVLFLASSCEYKIHNVKLVSIPNNHPCLSLEIEFLTEKISH